MQLLLSISALLLLVSSTSAKRAFSSDRFLFTSNTRFHPLVTKSFDQLIYVTFPFDPEPRILLETEKISYEPCELSFEGLYEVERPLAVNSLDDGKLVLSMLGSSQVFSLIIDLEKCAYEITTTDVNDDRESIVILPGSKEFEVFIANCSEDKACRYRYNETGALILTSFLDRPDYATDWSINSIGEMDFSRGYFYTIFTDNNTIVQRLDEDLEVKDELLLDSSFLFCDTWGAVNRCRGVGNYELECHLFNKVLDNEMTSSINLLKYKNFIRQMKLFNLVDGSMLILLVMQVYTEQTLNSDFSTHLVHVDLFGRSSRLFKFQDDVCKNIEDISLIRMRDNLFCVNIACRNVLRTKCIVFGA